jgi:carbonic anhydrase
VRAALGGQRLGLVDNWLRHVQDVRDKHHPLLQGLASPEQQCDRLCELNVIEQVGNVCSTSIVRDAWERGQPLAVHGWAYGLRDGLVHDLQTTVAGPAEVPLRYREALARAVVSGAADAPPAGNEAAAPGDLARNAS